ncbi:MAG: gamma-glutamyltransferase [Aequoribacter sp.]|uniref:gamma-glutamyltransferase n=1 Tax=Aequoribacter sp. TaxID=2847771 RepID=UPI003C64F5D9
MLRRLLLISLLYSTFAVAQPSTEQAPIIDYQDRFLPQVGRNGMVVGPERLASEIGYAILQQGGNAVDAAVATGFALAVTYPRAGNLGGGGFMLIHLADENKQVFIDYREMAPGRAQRDMYLDEFGDVDRQRLYFSYLSSGVPGTVAGLLHALENYGTMSVRQVLQPAVDLALKGIPVSFALNQELNSRKERLLADPGAASTYLVEGEAPQLGVNFRQSDLGQVLKSIRDNGRSGFYEGWVAKTIAQAMAESGGIITEGDLKNYRVVEREPVRGTFRGYEVVSAPPPSSGGTHIIQMLNILEPFDLQAMGHNSAEYIHHVIEAMKIAYADRAAHMGDPDFSPVPVNQLLSKEYAAKVRGDIDPTRARAATEIQAGDFSDTESLDTTHFSVADTLGNVVSNTYTLNFSYGSHIVVPGTGVLLNNEMADFMTKPGTPNAFGLIESQANEITAGKRPLSSMSPTLVFKDGQPWLATGSPGGSLIISTVMQTILNAMAFDMNIAAAGGAARVHHQWMPDTLRIENGVSKDTVDKLKAMGHPVEENVRTLGRTQSIMIQDGWFLGASDTRRPGGWVAGAQ